MGCASKVELTVCQVAFLVSICSVAVVLAVFGWFRGIDPPEYTKSPLPSASSKHVNNIASVVHSHLRLMPYLDDLGSPPQLNKPNSYIQWTILQMNDVYELKPLGGGKKGGMARVATIRKLLLQENPNTITIISGDIVSPSALGNSIVNGSMLNGKQMIATLNALGLDYATLGNHEFDLKEASLRRRLDESKFQWIASNVYERNSSTKPFHNILPYKIITISTIKILLIGLTIDDNLGPGPGAPYVNITAQKDLPKFTEQYVKYLHDDLNLRWDILICLTHLNLQNDIDIIEQNQQIHVIMGGHEHENYYLKRGAKYTPIYKADGNAFSVFIHRFAYQPTTKQLLIFSKLTPVSEHFTDEPQTAEVANYFYQVGLQAYRDQGYIPEEIVCVLPDGFTFDGRSAIVRSQQTHLTNGLCRAMMSATNTTLCVFNSGAIRIDDQLTGIITQYDILRCLPFASNLITINVQGPALVKVLNRGLSNINTGMFISYAGLQYDTITEKWYLQSTGQLLDDDNLQLKFVSIPYFFHSTDLKSSAVILDTYTTITKAFIDYLGRTYVNPKRLRSLG